MRLPLLPLLAALLLACAPGPARGAPDPVPTGDAVKFCAAVMDSLLSADGFTVRFRARGPGGYRGEGEISARRPLKIRIDTDAGGAPLAWVKNGSRVFLLLDGAGGRAFLLPDAAHGTSRIGPLPDTKEGLARALEAFLHAHRGRVEKELSGGYELTGASPASRASFRFAFDRDLRPVSFASAASGQTVWEIHFTDFRAQAPSPGRFEPSARQVFDLYR